MKKVLLLIFIFISHLQAQEYIWGKPDFGPYGADFISIDVDEKHQNIIYTVTFGGYLYISSDSGDTWQECKSITQAQRITQVRKSQESDYLFVGGNGLYRSSDNGNSFKNILSESIEKFELRPDSVIYVFTTNNDLIISHDYGNTWVWSITFPIHNFKGITTNKNLKNIYYFFNNGYYFSNDQGLTWDSVQLKIPYSNRVSMHPYKDSVLYTDNLISTNLGRTWEENNTYVKLIGIQNNKVVFFNSDNMISTDEGHTSKNYFKANNGTIIYDVKIINDKFYIATGLSATGYEATDIVICDSVSAKYSNFGIREVPVYGYYEHNGLHYLGTSRGIYTTEDFIDYNLNSSQGKVKKFYFISDSIGFALDNNFAAVTRDGGKTWPYDIGATSFFIYNDYYVAGNESGLYATKDSYTWEEWDRGSFPFYFNDSNIIYKVDFSDFSQSSDGKNFTFLFNDSLDYFNLHPNRVIVHEDKPHGFHTNNGFYNLENSEFIQRYSIALIEIPKKSAFIVLENETPYDRINYYDGVYTGNTFPLDNNLYKKNYGYNLWQIDHPKFYGKIFADASGFNYLNIDNLLGIQEDKQNIATSFNLYQNYPNPFNPTTKIKYSIPNSSKVNLDVYDILGNQIALLINNVEQQGEYEITFDAKKYNLSSGVYFYRLRANNNIITKKFVLMK